MTAKGKPKNEGRLFAIGDIHGCPDELEAILKSIAPAAGKGVDAVVDAIGKHREYLREHVDAARESERRTREFVEVLSAELEERAARAVADGGAPGVIGEVRAGKLNPYSAARRIIEDRKSLIDLIQNGNSKPRIN